MTLNEVATAFGTLTAACQAIGLTDQNVTQWRRQNYVPYLAQFKLAQLKPHLIPDALDPKPLRKNKIRKENDK